MTHRSITKLIHYDCDTITVSFRQDAPEEMDQCDPLRMGVRDTDFSNVDLPAPKNPHIMVSGTRSCPPATKLAAEGSSCSMRVLSFVRVSIRNESKSNCPHLRNLVVRSHTRYAKAGTQAN